ncbi:pectin lyase-like domain protein [Burkholderia cepacia]|nr:pectin lyase-like domain protein [Burkholderia cepacia]
MLYVTTGQFGARRDSTGINGTGTDDTTAVENALKWVCDRNRAYKLIASPGVHRLTRTLLPTAPYTIEGTSPAPKNVGESAIGGGSWFYFNHAGKGVSMINSAGDFKGVHIEQLGTIRDQPVIGPGWAPNNNDFDFYSYGVDDIFYRDVMLLNPTQGIYVNKTNNGRVDFERVRGQPFRVGIQVDQMYDVMRVNDVHWWSYWHDDPILWAYCRANCDGMRLYRVDSPIVDSYFAINCYSGIRVAQSSYGTTTKLQIGNITVDLSKYGIWWDSSVAGASAQIGNMEFQSVTPAIPGSKAIYVQANGAQVEISKFSSILTGTGAVRVEGANNTVRLGDVRAQLYDQDATGTPAIDCTTGNRVFISGWSDIGGALGGGKRYADNGTISVDEWRPYTCTLSASIGSIGEVGPVQAYYKQLNDSVHIRLLANINHVGTASGAVRASLPSWYSPPSNFSGNGKERANGKTVSIDVQAGFTYATIVNYDNSFPAFDGCQLVGDVACTIPEA